MSFSLLNKMIEKSFLCRAFSNLILSLSAFIKMYDVPIEMSGWVWRSLHIMSYPKDGASYLDEYIIYCVNLYLSIQVRFNPKQLGGVKLTPCPMVFQKMYLLKRWWNFFVTLKIMLKHIFPENSIEFPQVIQK